jgi:uncharacterized protein YbcV (DUF1398 family)
MNSQLQDIVTECTRASDESRMSFPEVVGALMKAGVERYYTDLTRSEKIYYMPDGDNIAVAARPIGIEPANEFDPAGVEAAIRAIQAKKITYHEFCRQIMAAGCVNYIVSLSGHRAVYLGRTGEAHVEPFLGVH